MTMKADGQIVEAVKKHEPFIASEILALSIKFDDCQGAECDINGLPATVCISKA